MASNSQIAGVGAAPLILCCCREICRLIDVRARKVEAVQWTLRLALQLSSNSC